VPIEEFDHPEESHPPFHWTGNRHLATQVMTSCQECIRPAEISDIAIRLDRADCDAVRRNHVATIFRGVKILKKVIGRRRYLHPSTLE
jgi:hypothetical protein